MRESAEDAALSRHVVSFCFDDGFAASGETIAQLFEERGWRAEFCVVTDPVNSADSYIKAGQVADFAFWREIAARGHRVSPHGDRHIHLGQVPIEEARAEIEAALDRFCAEMGIADADGPTYHCAYGHLPDALEPWLRSRVRAVRTARINSGINPLDWRPDSFAFDAGFPFPPDVAGGANERVTGLLAGPPAWLVLCLHGIDNEGWGPIAREDLARLLDRLAGEEIEVAPPTQAIANWRSDALQCVQTQDYSSV